MNLTPSPARPKLRSPQPNQTFFHVPPAGNSYTSNASGFVTPLTAADEAALRALGCVDVVEVKTVEVPVAKAEEPEEDAEESLRRR